MPKLSALSFKLSAKLSSLPQTPGVYIYKNQDGGIIYIGKAKNLRARVKQYFSGHDERPQIPFLLKEIFDFDYTVVDTELESLYLERTLIQMHTPKYNIQLRDDKSYTFIAFDYSTQIPQILLTRRIGENKFEKRNFRDESKAVPTTNYKLLTTNYFGPYTAAYKVREILKTIRYIFPYCTNAKVSNKPCFYYHLHRCPGVCIGAVPIDEYKLHLEKIKLFLKGNIKTVKNQLEKEMKLAAKKKLFEKAGRLKNQILGLQIIEQKQSVIIPKKVSWDVVGLGSAEGSTCVNLFKIREGKLTDKENFIYKTTDSNTLPDAYTNEVTEKFLEDYYSVTSDRPDSIYVDKKIENKSLIEELLKTRFSKKTKIIHATKKEPLRLLNMAKANAGEFLRQHLAQKASEIDKINSALNQLKDVLKLPAVPKRIECYDISNIQGTNAVGSMVVFEDGKPAKSQYRKFKIKSKETPDDFAMMKEMLSRRLNRSMNHVASSKEKSTWPLPDLMVIDGGRGQLSSAVSILHASRFTLNAIPTIGLAKRIEEIFLPNSSNPIVLGHDQPALQMLQRLRDEAHRFGITFHRALRSKQAVKSALDDIPGIGPKTKKLLKQKFGTVANIKQVNFEELEMVVGKKLAKKLKSEL